MRKTSLLFSLMLLLLASCEQNPDTDKLDNDYLVYTNYDKNADFGKYNTFYAIDSILLISDQATPKYWNNSSSQKIINEFCQNMIDNGYTEVATPAEADILLQLSYTSSTYYYYDYINGSPWWSSYPGYWNWNSYGWYYPFYIPYSFSTGSIIGELVDIKSRILSTDKFTVVWNAYICGLLNGNSLSMSKTIEGIDQAFTQSGYLSK